MLAQVKWNTQLSSEQSFLQNMSFSAFFLIIIQSKTAFKLLYDFS